MMRRKQSRGKARRDFRKGARTHGRNFAMAMRGGYRI